MIKLFLLGFIVVSLGYWLRRFVQGMHVSVSDAMQGKSVHIETAIGVFDLKPHQKLDPELASILVYPGATPAESQPLEYEADAQVLGQEYRILVATYWTLTPADIVWEFYRRELPGWQESRQRGRGRSLIQQTPDGVRTIRVYGQNNSTLIETKITQHHQAGAAAAGSGGSSSTRFGMLR